MFILICLLIVVVSTCDLKAKLSSETYHTVWAQFTFHNETKSQVYEFLSPDQNYTVHISDKFCNLKPTILKTYKKPPTPTTQPIGETSAFIEGMGVLGYTVYHDFPPRMGMRIGVHCGFGDCGSRG